ncbi:Ryanodine receptor 1 [Taenia solium]|eukprot:TsM_000442500 transcript=TsM_000442500 gene=TsM_000442500
MVSNSWFYLTWSQEMDLQYLLWKGLFLYLVVYFIVSLLGNADYSFFSCHLLDAAISFKTLTTIVQSVTHNGKQLLIGRNAESEGATARKLNLKAIEGPSTTFALLDLSMSP